jgi:hypothetical protein
VKVHKAEKLSKARAGVTEEFIREWFSKAEAYFTNQEVMDVLLNHPERVFNLDETGVFLNPRSPYVS